MVCSPLIFVPVKVSTTLHVIIDLTSGNVKGVMKIMVVGHLLVSSPEEMEKQQHVNRQECDISWGNIESLVAQQIGSAFS